LDLSFVILSWNSAHFLDRLFGTLADDLKGTGLTYEIFVIDNGSRDNSLEKLKAFREQGLPITVIPLGHNTGTTFSRNIGLRMSKGRFICVLDSDMEFCEPETLKRLVGVLEAHPEAGILVPTLKYPSGNHQKSVDRFPTIANKIMRLFWLRRMETAEGAKPVAAQELIEVDYAISILALQA
jgi:glycosyltransferase involved in cell wall biosynthesis